MYISAPQLDANFLRSMSLDVAANFFSLPLDRDEELSTGIYISKPVRSNALGTPKRGVEPLTGYCRVRCVHSQR
jgi:hypothetical protein